MNDIQEYNGKKFYTEEKLSSLIDVDFYSFRMKMTQYTYYKGVTDDNSIQPSTIKEATTLLKAHTEAAPELPSHPRIKDLLNARPQLSKEINDIADAHTNSSGEKLNEETPWLDLLIMESHNQAPARHKYIEGIFKLRPLINKNLASFNCGTTNGLTDTLQYTEYCSSPELSGEDLTLGVEHQVDFHQTSPPLYDFDEFITMCNKIDIPLKDVALNETSQAVEEVLLQLKKVTIENENLRVELENTKLNNKITTQGKNPLLRTINALATALLNRPMSEKINDDAVAIEQIIRQKQNYFNREGINYQFKVCNRKTLKVHLTSPD